VTESLVPPNLLAALPLPWQIADLVERGHAVRTTPPTPENRGVALTALAACLAYCVETKARYGDDPDWGLPPELHDDYSFMVHNTLRQWMPTLADVTRETVRDWAQKNFDPPTMFGAAWTAPPQNFIDNVARMWVHAITVGACEHLIEWFRRTAREHRTGEQRAQVVDRLKEATPRLSWRRAIVTIPAILDLGGPQQRTYFDQLANDPNVHEKTRDEAASVRWLIDRGKPPT
jgi:hypothetical protein